MKPLEKYEYDLDEEIVEAGIFICPTCLRKREYKKISRSFNPLAEQLDPYGYKISKEYVHCQGCLHKFRIGVLGPEYQSQIEINKDLLPPANILDLWQNAYTNLKRNDLISRANIVERVQLLTLVNNMKTVEMKLLLGKYEEARRYLIGILMGVLHWHQNFMLKFPFPDPIPDKKIKDHLEALHFLLSRLQ